jgi:hypothetical protein
MNLLARYINLLLGVWLVISAFVWRHTIEQQTNAWIVGVLVAVFALVAIGRERARYLNTLLSVWLLASIWVLPTVAEATQWNHGLVAMAVFIFSLVPNAPARIAGRTERGTMTATTVGGRV